MENARIECEKLVVRLTHAQDHDEAELAASLFVPDGVWIRSGKPKRGRSEIVKSFDRGGQDVVARHIVSSCLVEVEDDTHARATTYYLAYVSRNAKMTDGVRPLPVPASLGEWHDRFVLTSEGWRFERREGKRVFEA